jgi:hypothetical protein
MAVFGAGAIGTWNARFYTSHAMDEHDDDLESEVHEAAEQESESFPATGDELNDVATDQPADGEEGPPLDEDEAEI